MERYDLFIAHLALMADNFEVTDADMKNYSGDIVIEGVSGNQKVKVTVEMEEINAETVA